MNVRKLDAGLASLFIHAPQHAGDLEVFVQTTQPPTKEQAQILTDAGVRNVAPDRMIFTAVLSVDAVRELTRLPWIKAISSAKRMIATIRSTNG